MREALVIVVDAGERLVRGLRTKKFMNFANEGITLIRGLSLLHCVGDLTETTTSA